MTLTQLPNYHLVAKVNNKSKVTVFVILKADFFDEDGIFLTYDKQYVECLPGESIPYIELCTCDENCEDIHLQYETYDFKYDVEREKYSENHLQEVKLDTKVVRDEDNIRADVIVVNTAKRTLDYVRVAMICYDENNSIIGYVDEDDYYIAGGKSTELTLWPDVDDYYSFEIIPVCAYRDFSD